jgi:hypothetical protein
MHANPVLLYQPGRSSIIRRNYIPRRVSSLTGGLNQLRADNVRYARYYLTNAEIEVLETYADKIAERIPPNSIIVELGSG